jgi:hypothetical protein
VDAPSTLGPATEALFLDAFSKAALITAKRAAELLGLDEKTLAGLTERGVVRAVPRGKLRAYTERDLRAYLTEGPEAECRSTSPRKAASGSTISSGRVVAFTDLRGSRLDGQRKRSNGSSGKTRRKAG